MKIRKVVKPNNETNGHAFFSFDVLFMAKVIACCHRNYEVDVLFLALNYIIAENGKKTEYLTPVYEHMHWSQ